MPVTRLNHAVLYVRDVQATRDFYETVLGFRTLIWVPGRAAFFQARLCLITNFGKGFKLLQGNPVGRLKGRRKHGLVTMRVAV